MDASWLADGEENSIPADSWEKFCYNYEISKPDSAKSLLQFIARDGFSAAINRRAEELRVDPLIYWIWVNSPDWRGEIPGMPLQGDVSDPDNHYLLNLMRRKCRGDGVEDWQKLADDARSDRELYFCVKVQLAAKLGVVCVKTF